VPILAVATDKLGCSLGKRLKTEILLRAALAGVRFVSSAVASGNEPMLRLNMKLGAQIRPALKNGGPEIDDEWFDCLIDLDNRYPPAWDEDEDN
jgi:hypothetical protein